MTKPTKAKAKPTEAKAKPTEAKAKPTEAKAKPTEAKARNIGLPVKNPKMKPEDNDKKNPFNGSLSIRGKIFEGKVIKSMAKNTVILEKEFPIYFEKFKRYGRSKNRIHAHVPSNLDVNDGDLVVAAECRPLAKSVSFVVVEVKE
jgi:small subunit ribosomal protein S17